MIKSNTHIGNAAEHLVCVDFLLRGYDAIINSFPASPFDVVVDLGKRMLRVQVKASRQSKLRAVNRSPQPVAKQHESTKVLGYSRKLKERYTFKINMSKYAAVDLFAFVVLDTKEVLYVPAAELNTGGSRGAKHFGAKKFRETAEGSLDRFLAAEAFT